MSRWEPDARGRLAQAAMELYRERGYEQTTVAQIAERAGVTERTFFRHFADKREVLFDGGQALQEHMVAAVEAAPPSESPLDLLAAALDAAAGQFAEMPPEFPRRRQEVVAAHPALQERELIKLARLSAALREALRHRGVAEPAAGLTAETGVAVFRVAFERWAAGEAGPDLAVVLRDSLAELRALSR
ncbi:TetR/AcrR family transcriptional regulator [Petropleomorpha daqingensis]|uniref:AcrR family transcriptional regulator n=1 Tax=Petropleomorpha daqingensis TaxID=2026353 RepID=A0A853CDR1_9ACTN|nr:TetR/AcrR family transcriptional regulator [Petropleomorpha daqingensis]NYJ05236.1 AcrR family transcriptional regulator [Petropleomorpha daqingensis]